MPCDYSLRTEPRRPLKTQMCLRLSHTENIEIYYIFSFLFYLHYYNICFSGDTRLLPTISRLFADYSATALRLFRACAGSRAGICVQFRRGRATCLGGRSGSRSAGQPWAALAWRTAGSAEDLRARTRRRYQGGAGDASICAGIAL